MARSENFPVRTNLVRCPFPVTMIVDSQSVKGAETVGKDSRGWDEAKKINGRKRHIAVDTKGLPVMVMVSPHPQPPPCSASFTATE